MFYYLNYNLDFNEEHILCRKHFKFVRKYNSNFKFHKYKVVGIMYCEICNKVLHRFYVYPLLGVV